MGGVLVDGLGWPTALVTNTGRAIAEAALDSIGREHFTVSVCADEVASGKEPARQRVVDQDHLR